MALIYPLVAWGSAEDISASPWADSNGTPIVTGGQADPFGGTSAYLIEDDNAAGSESRRSDVVAVVTAGEVAVAVFAKAGTATVSVVDFRDATAGVVRHSLDLAWSGGVPTPTTRTGAGTILTPISVGSSWYLIIFTATGCVSGNTHEIKLFGAATGTTPTGTTVWYVRNAVLLPPLDQAVASDDPRAGYESVQNPSGVEDAWTVGTDHRIEADIRFVSKMPVDSPLTYSGWDGLNEISGVNVGLGAMLRAGRDKSDLIYVPDRSDCSTFITSKLDQPLQGGVALEEDGTRRVRVVLRNGSTEYEGYA